MNAITGIVQKQLIFVTFANQQAITCFLLPHDPQQHHGRNGQCQAAASGKDGDHHAGVSPVGKHEVFGDGQVNDHRKAFQHADGADAGNRLSAFRKARPAKIDHVVQLLHFLDDLIRATGEVLFADVVIQTWPSGHDREVTTVERDGRAFTQIFSQATIEIAELLCRDTDQYQTKKFALWIVKPMA